MEKGQEFITRKPSETEDLGAKFVEEIKAGDIIFLNGNLGAGKTTFVKGVSSALRTEREIISPTFILVRKYNTKNNQDSINSLYHIDLYRLEDSTAVESIGLSEIIQDKNGVFFIEWGDKYKGIKPTWEINFETIGKDERRVKINE